MAHKHTEILHSPCAPTLRRWLLCLSPKLINWSCVHCRHPVVKGLRPVVTLPVTEAVKERHGSGNKGNFECGQNKIKTCSYILKDRECNPLFVTMDTSCKLYVKRDNVLQLRTSNSFIDYQLPSPSWNGELCTLQRHPVVKGRELLSTKVHLTSLVLWRTKRSNFGI